MGNVDIKKVVLAGTIGTAGMTFLMIMGPMMGMPEMNMGKMLGTMNPIMPLPEMVGWAMHFMIGILLAYIYAAFLIKSLPSTGWRRGMIFAPIPWLVKEMMMSPMMGMGFFSGGDMMMLIGGIMGHLVYGGLMGHFYGEPESSKG